MEKTNNNNNKPVSAITLVTPAVFEQYHVDIDYVAASKAINKHLEEGVIPYDMSKIYGSELATDGAIGQRRSPSFSDMCHNSVLEGMNEVKFDFELDYKDMVETGIEFYKLFFKRKVALAIKAESDSLEVIEVFPKEEIPYVIVANKHVPFTKNSKYLLDRDKHARGKFIVISNVLYTNHFLWYCVFTKIGKQYFAILLPPEIDTHVSDNFPAEFGWDILSTQITISNYNRAMDKKDD